MTRRPSLWLVTPVYGRRELTRVCLEQRVWLISELDRAGVEAHQVVIGDGRDLDAARELELHVLPRRRNLVGFKVNEGIEYACREGGADFVSYIGSDDWALPAYYAAPPGPARVQTGGWRAIVSPDGERLVVIRMLGALGIAPWIIPKGLLMTCGFRPAEEHRMSGVDGSIRRSLIGPPAQQVERRRRRPRPRDRTSIVFHVHDVDELQRVGFKGGDNQITAWHRAVGRNRRRVLRDEPAAEALATRYPAELVERVLRRGAVVPGVAV